MIRRVGLLVLGTLASYLLFFLPMRFLVKEAPAAVVAVAALLSLVPGAVVLIANARLRDKPPEVKIVAVLLTTAFRMAAVVGGGVLCYFAVPAVREHALPFIGWAVVFYLVTLFVETGLLYTDSSGQTRTPPGS